MKSKYYLLLMATAFFFGACSHKYVYSESSSQEKDSRASADASTGATRHAEELKVITPVNTNRQSMIPKATAFKMSGDYADNVAVTIGPDGNLTYYPAPSDISEYSKPLDLGNGWWLNRQGIGKNSVFTKYTFEEYSSLPKVPTQQELKEAVIPGARVTAVTELPYSIGEATNHIPEIKEFLEKQ